MGADFDQATERTYINSSTGAMYGDSLLIQNWYEFELHVNFSLPGARATLKYRNLTAGQTSFAVDSILQNVNLGLIADGSGLYQADYVLTRNDSGSMSDTYLDNLFFQAPVPTCEAPQVSQHPQSATISPGAIANFTIAATGTATLSYQWRKNNVNLNNGASGCSSTISGATTAQLTVTNVSTSDNASYDCVVTNACGSDTSDTATLTVPAGPACAGDMDGNNVVNGDDIDDFVAKLLAGGPCS